MYWPTVGRRKIGNTAGLCHGGFGSEGIKIKAASNSKQAFAMNPVGGRGGLRNREELGNHISTNFFLNSQCLKNMLKAIL